MELTPYFTHKCTRLYKHTQSLLQLSCIHVVVVEKTARENLRRSVLPHHPFSHFSIAQLGGRDTLRGALKFKNKINNKLESNHDVRFTSVLIMN